MLNDPALKLAEEVRAALIEEADRHIAAAAEHDIALTYENFQVLDGELWLDSMEPGEWIEAMTMD